MQSPAVLTRKRFQDAKDYLFSAGRPLDQQLFQYHFEDGQVESVLHELASYQLDDGGFKDMGEGDDGISSPIGSTCAFQHLVDLSVGVDYPIVRSGIEYFLSSYDSNYGAWPQRADDPHYLENDLDLNWGNPSAEIVGYLWEYRELVPDEFLEHVTEIAVNRFVDLDPPVPGFSDLCYLRLAELIPDEDIGSTICRKVAEGMRQNLELDHSRWHQSYFIKPYWYAKHPDSPMYDLLSDEINACLDFDIETQEPDGSAYLTFDVSGDVMRTWKSIWTLESVIALSNYGRLAATSC